MMLPKQFMRVALVASESKERTKEVMTQKPKHASAVNAYVIVVIQKE